MMNFTTSITEANGLKEDFTCLAVTREAAILWAMQRAAKTTQQLIFIPGDPNLSEEDVRNLIQTNQPIFGHVAVLKSRLIPRKTAAVTVLHNVTIQVRPTHMR